MKKVIVIIGSRNPDGQTAKAADALTKGLEEKGLEIEEFFLPEMKIEHCRQCENDGWGTCRSGEKCTVGDDFDMLVEKLGAVDLVVFATPVYFSDISESIRAFLERLRRLTIHQLPEKRVTNRKAVGICVAGGGGGGAPNCVGSLEKILLSAGFDVVDMVPARRQNLNIKMDLLKILGRRLAE